MKQLTCFFILTAMVFTVTAHATHLNAVEGGELIYKSRFMIDDKGDKLLTHLPLENITGSKSPVVLKALDGICEQTLMLFDIKDTLIAYGVSENQKHYAGNQPLLDVFKLQPIHKITGLNDLNKGPMMMCDNGLDFNVNGFKMGMTFIQANGTIKFVSNALDLDTFFMPRSRLVIQSSVEESPIQKIILYIANSTLPMRVSGLVVFSKNPIVQLETMNVRSIKVIHKYNKAEPAKIEEK